MDKEQSSYLRAVLMMVILGGAYFFSNFHRLAMGVLAAPIATDMYLTSLQTGTLGSAIFYSYSLMQIPCGIIADRISARKTITISCILTAISTIWFAFAESFPVMICARIITGASTALVYVPALSIIRKQFGDGSFGMMTGIMIAMGQMGSVCATAPLKFLNDVFGWKTTFIFMGILTMVLSFGAWILVMDDDRTLSSAKNLQDNKNGSEAIMWSAVIFIAVWFFITGGTRLSFQSLWGNMFFINGKDYTANISSVFLTLLSIGCIIGSVVLGKVSDKIGSILTLAISTFLMAADWAILALIPNKLSVLTGFFCMVLGAVGAGGFTVGFSCVRFFATKEKTGIITGINNSFAFLGSALFTQLCGKYMELLPFDSWRSKFTVLLLTFSAICFLSILPMLRINKYTVERGGVNEETTIRV